MGTCACRRRLLHVPLKSRFGSLGAAQADTSVAVSAMSLSVRPPLGTADFGRIASQRWYGCHLYGGGQLQ